ncbi:hypothetical protein [Fodinibius sediminis]|uniref:Polymerase/histidinol phosphatase N-terminal domain-containing protein n=1 Tax=Fodinibius sediminis TaxID=1214077 RepID=A0A521D0F5_9BACT|nr:hypothetical protein [Fodinibius sediminis]SMO65197.1 hypothetical protein SAMN06265218_10862 [Fodinibius sediminis]
MKTGLKKGFITAVLLMIGLGGADAQSAHPADHASHHTHKTVDYTVDPDTREEATPVPDEEGFYWWKGNLHTHTLWSDGDHFPETVAKWYRNNGYHFLSLSDHNTLQTGDKWIQPRLSRYAASAGGVDVFEQYLEEFGKEWVEFNRKDDTLQVRLKPLSEYRHLFEEPGRFLLIQGEEITDEKVIHMNAHNIGSFIEPQGGETVRAIIQNNVNAVHKHQKESGRPVLPHLNHPNFHYAVTAEDLAHISGLRFFEVYNGHRGVQNYGDEHHVDLDRYWDIVLTLRLAHLDKGIMYGLATDDAHHYDGSTDHTALPGRGWVMVKARYLTPRHIITALKKGDYYATTGVTLRDFSARDKEYLVEIEPEEGIDYKIQFIGTPKDHDISSEEVLDENGKPIRATRTYSREIGQVYREVEGTQAKYEYTGDELYVRAKIISTKKHPNPFQEGETEMAWTQPVLVE